MCAAQIGVIYGNPEVTSGGNALKFYASVRLEVRRKMTHESAKGESTGIRVKAKVGGVPFAPTRRAPALHTGWMLPQDAASSTPHSKS